MRPTVQCVYMHVRCVRCVLCLKGEANSCEGVLVRIVVVCGVCCVRKVRMVVVCGVLC